MLMCGSYDKMTYLWALKLRISSKHCIKIRIFTRTVGPMYEPTKLCTIYLPNITM